MFITEEELSHIHVLHDVGEDPLGGMVLNFGAVEALRRDGVPVDGVAADPDSRETQPRNGSVVVERLGEDAIAKVLEADPNK